MTIKSKAIISNLLIAIVLLTTIILTIFEENSSSSYINYFLILITLITLVFNITTLKTILLSIKKLNTDLDYFFTNISQKKADVIDIENSDEFGQIITEINTHIGIIRNGFIQDSKFLVDINRVLNDINNGKIASKIEVEANNPDLIDLKTLVNSMLDKIQTTFNEITISLTEIANGDLTVRINNDYIGEPEDIKNIINQLADKLENIILKVSEATEIITSGSEQVNLTAHILVQGANEQAGNIEDTVTTLEEVRGTININSSNANITKERSSNISNLVEDGEEAVNHTVRAMESIAEKIDMVESIAYQTNLLAINASIEAGKAGKNAEGFSAVAKEVRKLSERSQMVASEISDEAMESVVVGQKAEVKLNEIIPTIKETTGLINIIALSSDKQDGGIDKINTTINQLEDFTQQNIVTTEELTAYSEDILEQARDLSVMLEFFKVRQSDKSKLIESKNS